MATNDIDMPDSVDADDVQVEPLMEAVDDPADADMNGEFRSLKRPTNIVSRPRTFTGQCTLIDTGVHAPITEAAEPQDKQQEEEDSMEGTHTVRAM